MKSFLILAAVALTLSGCGGNTLCGGTYSSYGVANVDDIKNPNIEYRVSVGSVIVGVIFFETVIVPVFVILFDIMEPVSFKKPGVIGGPIDRNYCPAKA